MIAHVLAEASFTLLAVSSLALIADTIKSSWPAIRAALLWDY